MKRESTYIAINILDRYMIQRIHRTRENLKEQQIQEIAATCLYIASKMEEIYPPNME
jgi:hypothetical protein